MIGYMEEKVEIRWRLLIAPFGQSVCHHVSGVHPEHLGTRPREDLHHPPHVDGAALLSLRLGLYLCPQTLRADHDKERGPRTVV